MKPTCARISKNSQMIGVSYNHSTFVSKVYDYASRGATSKTFTAGGIVIDLDFNFNSTLFVVTGYENAIKVWNVAT